MNWRPGSNTTVDFLYADIWLQLAEPQALGQARRMHENLQARTVYFWGQELAIYSALQRESQGKFAATADAIRTVVADVIDLPLLIPDDRDYALMIERVIRNRIDRGLRVDTPSG